MHRKNNPSTAAQRAARRGALRAGLRATVATLTAAVALPPRAQAAAKRVLIVHSFSREIAPYDAVLVTFRRELASRSSQAVVFLEATLDAGRAVDAAEEAAFIAYLNARFAHPAPHLIVSVAEPAASFLLRRRAEVFPDVPLLQAAIDTRNVPRAALKPGDAAMATTLDLPRSFADLLRVLPRTRTIAVVLGATPLERFWRREVERETAFLAERVPAAA